MGLRYEKGVNSLCEPRKTLGICPHIELVVRLVKNTITKCALIDHWLREDIVWFCAFTLRYAVSADSAAFLGELTSFAKKGSGEKFGLCPTDALSRCSRKPCGRKRVGSPLPANARLS